MSENGILDSEQVDGQKYELAGFWIRFGAYILDGLILTPVTLILIYSLMSGTSFVLFIVLSILSYFYKPLMEGYYGATLGKMICKIEVRSEDFKRINLSQSFVRSLLWLFVALSSLMESYPMFEFYQTLDSVMDLTDPNNQPPESSILSSVFQVTLLFSGLMIARKSRRGLHDLMGKTVVVFKKK